MLSPTTRKNDRSVKLQEYMRHRTLRTIVHIDPDLVDVLVYGRGADGQWDVARLEDLAAEVELSGMDVRLPLGAVYDGVPLGPAADA